MSAVTATLRNLHVSARKARLYTVRETLRFYYGLLVTRGRALRTPEGTFLWYDGRRE